MTVLQTLPFYPAEQINSAGPQARSILSYTNELFIRYPAYANTSLLFRDLAHSGPDPIADFYAKLILGDF